MVKNCELFKFVLIKLIDILDIMDVVRRNYLLPGEKRDIFIEWMKDMLNHSFVLNLPSTFGETFTFVETLIDEHRRNGVSSRLSKAVPGMGRVHTPLPLRRAYEEYDKKYCITQRKFIRPSFNEIRHIVNLAQVMEIGKNLKLISFDGDQTLYSDGGNFEPDSSLSNALKELLKAGVYVAVVTAAGYGLVGSKYEVRIGTLLKYLQDEGLTKTELERFYVMGGECNYLLNCSVLEETTEAGELVQRARLVPVLPEVWQAPVLVGPKPAFWDKDEVNRVLDVAEKIMKGCIEDLHLRVQFVRKERAIGMFPGGPKMVAQVPVGHGSNKVKREALDEIVFMLKEGLQQAQPPVELPYCVFNGGRDVWLDIGNKSVGVAAMQAYLNISPDSCLYVGDQFLNTGNDIAARAVSPCIWISNPSETGKILQHVLKQYGLGDKVTGEPATAVPSSASASSSAPTGVFNAFTGQMS